MSPVPRPQVSAEQSGSDEQQQKVRSLIRQVDEAYARGEANYRKGKLPEAKVEFDRAVDLMLTSGLDIKGDSRLQEEFDGEVLQTAEAEEEID